MIKARVKEAKGKVSSFSQYPRPARIDTIGSLFARASAQCVKKTDDYSQRVNSPMAFTEFDEEKDDEFLVRSPGHNIAILNENIPLNLRRTDNAKFQRSSAEDFQFQKRQKTIHQQHSISKSLDSSHVSNF